MGSNTSGSDADNLTPKIAQMQLKVKKYASCNVNFSESISEMKSAFAIVDCKRAVSTTDSLQIRELHPLAAKLTSKKLQEVRFDLPCEPEEESSTFDFVSPGNTPPAIIPAPFTFAESFPKTTTENMEGLEMAILRELKPDDLKERAKALALQAKLVEAILNTPICDFCKRPLNSDQDHFASPCGHTFHHNCVERTIGCPECCALGL
eukprot:TRINITY_DN670_c0_g2_i3.p1 TRINITY_DN670_c0_g2~~TRINITY_DN670_c0_g2_i3.p1  ORF type:complete len:207 (+),score=44.52 TRINITY_DN670_c0_g2_i3:1181-1801(+)